MQTTAGQVRSGFVVQHFPANRIDIARALDRAADAQLALAGCGKTPERSRIPEAFACWGVLRGSPEGQM
jgi:hypothetical protein